MITLIFATLFEIDPTTYSPFVNGVYLTLPAELKILKAKEVLLAITEGKFHQVKRMFAAVGNRVISLHREKIGMINLDVKEGQWRYLTTDEVQSFKD